MVTFQKRYLFWRKIENVRFLGVKKDVKFD